MWTKDCLDNEIGLIKDGNIRQWTKKTIENAPERFFKIPASSTGKYHPECTNGEGGLIVHVRRVVFFCDRLSFAWNIDGVNKDICISACILHDLAKTGKDSGAYIDYVNHPINALQYFQKSDIIKREVIEKIENAVKYHMGLWTPDQIKKPLKEYTGTELLVYTSDYLASTKEVTTPKDIIFKVQE